MSLSFIKVLNFRNIEQLELGNFERLNILLGPNGSGKTNFLESLFLLCSGTSFRNVQWKDLVKWGKDSFYIGGIVFESKKEIGYSFDKKILKIDNKAIDFGNFFVDTPAIVFLPEDIQIVTGTPDERRNFIDQALCLIDMEYEENLKRYHRVLRQRNAQLKQSQSEVFIWNKEFIETGSRIIEKRLNFVQNIGKIIQKIYSDFYEEEIVLRYLNTFKIEHSIEDSFRGALERSAGLEKEKKFTLIGPHRDCYEVLYFNKNARVSLSQGQKRALALAFKWSLMEIMENLFKKKPILLLDDVLLEIDSIRRKKFIEKSIHYQVFLTLTSKEIVKGMVDFHSTFAVDDGIIKKE